MVSDEPRKGHAILTIARHAAAPALALLLSAAGVLVLLDSGTTRLPSAAPGSSSAPTTPHENVTVSPTGASKKPAHRHVSPQAPRKQTGTRSTPQSSAPATTSPASRPVSRPVTRPVHHSRTGGKPHSKPPPSHSGGSGSGGTGSGGTGSGGSGSGGSGSGGTGTPTAQPPQEATVASSCSHPRGLALGHLKHANGLALGHRSKPCKTRTNSQHGLALGHQKQHGNGGADDPGGSEDNSDQGHSSGNGHGHHSNGRGHPNDAVENDQGGHGHGQDHDHGSHGHGHDG